MARPDLLLRYPGGKYYALKHLKKYWEQVDHKEYREPFVGGGSVFLDKDSARENWVNDVDEELINLYKVVADPETRKELIDKIDGEEASKERHSEVCDMEPSNKIEKAFKYFYLNRTSFSGKMQNPSWGYREGRSVPPERWDERIKSVGKKLEKAKITNKDYKEVIQSQAEERPVLMYLDPPYYGPDYYKHNFTEEDHEELAELLRNTPFNFILSYEDHERVRELYDWAYIYPLELTYRMSNSEDDGGDSDSGSRKEGKELVITNFPVKAPKQKKLEGFDEDKGTETQAINTPDWKASSDYVDDEEARTPFRYPGSKYRARKYLRPFWQKIPHDEYREPMFGGGAIFFSKPKSKYNWLNDLDEELMTTVNVLKDPDKRENLIERLEGVEASKEKFEEIKESNPSEELEIAARYFYINRTAYSGIMNMPNWGYSDEKSVPPERWDERIREAGKKLEGAKVTSKDYNEVLKTDPEGKKVLYYMDPPYYEADQQRAYKHSFTEEDHEKLAQRLKSLDQDFILTYDDCEWVRQHYDWAVLHPRKWRYHTANSNNSDRRMGHELIITNFGI